MGYYVKIEELLEMQNNLQVQMETWTEQLEQVETTLNVLSGTTAIQGKTGDSVRSYVSEVHLPLVTALLQMISEFRVRFSLYADGYYDIDGSNKAEIFQENLENQQTLLLQEKDTLQHITENINQALWSVNDIVSIPCPDHSVVTGGFQTLVDVLKTLNERIGEYENTHQRDGEDVDQLISAIQSIIDDRAGDTQVKPVNYQQGSILTNPNYQQLGELVGESQDFITQNMSAYEQAIAQYGQRWNTEVLEDIQADFDSGKITYEDYNFLQYANKIGASISTNLDSISMLRDGVYFTLDKSNGKYYIGVAGSSITGPNKKTWAQLQDYLQRNISDVNWRRYDVKELTRDGIRVGSQRGDQYFGGRNNASNVGTNLSQAYSDIAQGGRLNYAGSQFSSTFSGSINPLENFKGWGDAANFQRFGKGMGIAGDVFTVGSNFRDTFWENGEFEMSADAVQDFATDTTIDIASGAAAMAAGAAIGSAFLPPAGTVVGAVAGIAIDAAINWDVVDWDGDGEKDSLVDGVKMGVDSLCDSVGEAIGNIFW